MFKVLKWSEIQKSHKDRWDTLYKKFGLNRRVRELDNYTTQETKATFSAHKLDIIANFCIEQCEALLFSLGRIEGEFAFVSCDTDFSEADRNLMRFHLKQALQDHLIVEFSYRFLCDNMEYKGFKYYADLFYEYTNKGRSENYISKVEIQAQKKDNFENLKRKYENLCKEIATEYKDYMCPDTKCIPPITSSFLLFLASVRMDLRRLRKADDQYCELSNLFRKSTYASLLCNTEDSKEFFHTSVGQLKDIKSVSKEKNQEKIMLLDVPQLYYKYSDMTGFVGIPFDGNSKHIQPMTLSKCVLKDDSGDGSEVSVSREAQIMFNNYLIERYFHLGAMTNAKYAYCRVAEERYDYKRLEYLMLPMYLEAPLLQSAFIEFLGSKQRHQLDDYLLRIYINRWNSVALPVLEELFLWSVFENCSNAADVAKAIEQSVFSEFLGGHTRYQRMNMFRLMPTSNCVNLSLDAELFRELHGDLVKYAFMFPSEPNDEEAVWRVLSKN